MPYSSGTPRAAGADAVRVPSFVAWGDMPRPLEVYAIAAHAREEVHAVGARARGGTRSASSCSASPSCAATPALASSDFLAATRYCESAIWPLARRCARLHRLCCYCRCNDRSDW